ncbi:hypothetical protein ABOM_003055 [Aspergillus bombycis]|uniref:Uncharacterized protein n=1 Tax=Aspergillus bombycis TaxID=109264 RepID=A0A1F8ABI6_9EURO|nr:hypothetical protein ABOM_003055 [Aspergillus bombycis]OGM48779.1 hypothetical protein ABOM_003055 [Aspergillus bombycis]
MGLFPGLGVGLGTGDQNEMIIIDQSVPVTVEGKEYEVSGAEYKSLFNEDAGLIVVDNVISPEHAKRKETPMEDIVPLRQWSDVTFLLWERYTKGALGVYDIFFKYSPMRENGRTFRPGSEEYYALLYCPNGRGIGWLLTQHKAQLGLLTVSSITVFGEDGEAMLYFKIDPVEQND